MTESPKLRFCFDCRWCYVGGSTVENARCRHPNNYRSDRKSLVTGRAVGIYIGSEFCETQRRGKTECGKAGTWWEPTTGDGVGVDNSK